MDNERLREVCAALPAFPLPRAVLLPGAALPLHVFEPRYRALVAHCLGGDGLMGIATLRPGEDPGSDSAAVWPEIGVGEVVGHQPFPDGRCNIVLQYVGAVRLREELPRTQPFRLLRCEPCPADDRGVGAALGALRVLVLQLGTLSAGAASEARKLVQLEGMELADALARRLLRDPDEQRAYLAATRLVDRVGAVQEHLATFFAAASAPADS